MPEIQSTLRPMPTAPTRAPLLTVEDYRATPDEIRYQLVEGELIMFPSPTTNHQGILWNFAGIFDSYLKRHPVGRAFFAPLDVYLSKHDVFQPDVLFIAKANLGILKKDGVHGAPDIVVEVLSPSNAQLDKKTKRGVYARAGVKEFWLVDPRLLQIQISDFAGGRAKPVGLIKENDSFTSPLLPGLTIRAADVLPRRGLTIPSGPRSSLRQRLPSRRRSK